MTMKDAIVYSDIYGADMEQVDEPSSGAREATQADIEAFFHF